MQHNKTPNDTQSYTPRDRVLALLSGRQPDQVPWFADLDYFTTGLIARGEKPADFKQSDAYIDWHRELGAGFYLQGHFPFKQTLDACDIKEWREGDIRFRRIDTPEGSLSERWKYSNSTHSEAPIERLVKSEKDLAPYRFVYKNMKFEPDYSRANRLLKLVGDIGVVLCYTPRSPFMRMVALDAGIENLLTAYMDAPEEFEETIRVMKRSLDAAVEIAAESPAEILMIPENLSSEVVGVNFFEMFMKDIQTDWVGKIHQAGKYSTIHIDGTLRGLLRQEAAVGYTFIEAMTPAPTGDLKVSEWAGYLRGTDCVAWGGVPGAFFTENVSDEEFDHHVIETLEIMRGNPKYVLGVADQVPPNGTERRIRRVRELVDTHGKYEWGE